ncbi:Clp protease ClpP [Streptococcus sp. 121]|uniref:head maturation protease, ClpP-related n=1 Tax=Streptococcus sp. 121 TaxID=2797637 RepID=UPI0018F0B545|nr:head maturation protease, ClpP-related [Streptococcus sp. 121]MBJ6745211.1 Clp protease ClpP [Streptococcus sp. 121]
MEKIEIKGTIVDDGQAAIYKMFGIVHTSPSSVILPEDGSDILVEINSGGGAVFAGSEIFTKLKAYEGKVTARVVGLAASAASVILMGADEVEISPTAQIMIHNAWSYVEGDADEMEAHASVLRGINKSIQSAYIAKTGLSEEELKDYMDAETWLTADEAVELGFADKVMFAEEQTNPANVYASVGCVLPDEVLAKVDMFMKQENLFDIDIDLDDLSAKIVNSIDFDGLADKIASRLQKTDDKPQRLSLF